MTKWLSCFIELFLLNKNLSAGFFQVLFRANVKIKRKSYWALFKKFEVSFIYLIMIVWIELWYPLKNSHLRWRWGSWNKNKHFTQKCKLVGNSPWDSIIPALRRNNQQTNKQTIANRVESFIVSLDFFKALQFVHDDASSAN